MNSQDTGTCCFLISTKDHPVRLIDSCTGKLRATYSTKDAADETKAPLCARFSLDGLKVYCGFENSIQIFDTGMPGTDCDLVKLTPTRKSRDGIKGLITDVSFNPDQSGMYAVSSYSGQIGILDERSNGILLALNDPNRAGVTQCRFGYDGNMLYSTARAAEGIHCWDIRNTAEILHTFPRVSRTNQRMRFALSYSQLVTGDQDGRISVYDLASTQLVSQFGGDGMCVGEVSFNPADCSEIAACEGERVFDCFDEMVKRRENKMCIWKL
jgi:telomerase Cajal body protein 1